MHPARQLDLFAAGGFAAPAPVPAAAAPLAPDPTALTDDELIAALPNATQRDCRALTRQAAQRCLSAAIPALVSLCRRFRGFGRDSAVAEQLAAMRALAAIGGREAANALVSLVADGTVQGPGLAVAIEAAAHLNARLPAQVALPLLRHEDPWVRAGTARCARTNAETIQVLKDLLTDLNADVATEAAHALGRAGQAEALPALFRLLAEHPTEETIDAITPIADEPTIVLFGRIARANPELADACKGALEDSEHPRAAVILKGLG